MFYIILHLRIEHEKSKIYLKLTKFDTKIDNFHSEFNRIRPYVNILSDHYNCPNEAEGLNEYEKEFNFSVIKYCQNRNDENYTKIGVSLEKIIEFEDKQPEALSRLVLSKLDPLSLSVFFLSPLPSKHLIPSQSYLAKYTRSKKDSLFLYLATLRQPNIFRGFLNLSFWIKTYDNDAFSEFGNVFSYKLPDNLSLAKRLNKVIPELKASNSNDITEILKDSEKIIYVKAPNKFLLTVSIEDIVKDSKEHKEEESIQNNNVLLVETNPNSAKYFAQISETINAKNSSFNLKAMLIQKDPSSGNKLSVLIFDKTYQIWTMFTDDGSRALSMPRQIARLYYVQYGKYLVYSK